MKIKGNKYKFTVRGIILLLVAACAVAFGGGSACTAVFTDLPANPERTSPEDEDGAVPASSGQTAGIDAQGQEGDAPPPTEDEHVTQPPEGSKTQTADNAPEQVVDSAQDISVLALVNKTNAIASDYTPHTLVKIADYTPGKDEAYSYGRPELVSAFDKLLADAKKANLKIVVSNVYRSYAVQKATFESNVQRKGSVEAANKTSAKPGESEHQTGLAMDLTTQSVGYGVTGAFQDTPEGKWVKDNCYRYGFIIRYPEGKEDITGYSYEPWHIRYVGEKAAKVMHENGWTLEEYLVQAE